jgi:F0F1-type ATP synthase delta subunit
MENAYAQVIWRLVQGGTSVRVAISKVEEHLTHTGRQGLMPRVMRSLSRLVQSHTTQSSSIVVATAADATHASREAMAKHTIQDTLQTRVDPSLIGGWRLETPVLLIDTSYKKTLLEIYRKATS